MLLLGLASPVLAQSGNPDQDKSGGRKIAQSVVADQSGVPVEVLAFSAVESDPSLSISPVLSFPPHCASDGSLFLDMLDPKDPRDHTVIAVRGKKTQTYLPLKIPDLHDVFVMNYFPSDSIVGFLVRATRESPGAAGPGRSPAGVEWSKYHNYIAIFDRNGSYKESIELAMNYSLSHLAVFPSGDFLVSGYDRVNSALQLLYLDSSGKIIRTLQIAASRLAADGNAPYGSAQSMMESTQLLGSIVFTAYNQDILIWRRNSNDPILDVAPGGTAREVPLQLPPRSVFVNMIDANDRWVAQFRSSSAVQDSPLNPKEYSYYTLRAHDGSLVSKLIQSGITPLSIACENAGTYTAFKWAEGNKLVLLNAN